MGHGDICKCDQLRADLARAIAERDSLQEDWSDISQSVIAWKGRAEAAEARCKELSQAYEHALERIRATEARLAEVEAQAAAIRKKMLEFATMYRDVPSDYVRIWIEESSADAGRALLAELKDLRKENEQLEADIERCHSTTLGDERRAMWKELQALRLVRDAAEEVVAMSEPGMPTLRDVAVDALRAALDEAKEAGT